MVEKAKNRPKASSVAVEILWLREEKRKQFVEYLLGPAYGGRNFWNTTDRRLRPDNAGWVLIYSSGMFNCEVLDKKVLKNETEINECMPFEE